MSIRKKCKDFANKPLFSSLADIKCGFELETQAVDGMDWSDCGHSDDAEIDWEQVSEYCCEQAYETISNESFLDLYRSLSPRRKIQFETDCRDYIINMIDRGYFNNRDPQLKDETPEEYHARLMSTYTTDPIDLLDGDTFNASWTDVLSDDIQDCLRECYEESERENICDWSEFYITGGSSDSDKFPDLQNAGFDVSQDGSVNGPEIKCPGNGVTAARFAKLLKTLTNDYDLDVDTGCSFHIHLSVNEVTHKYSAQFQLDLISYLVENIGSVPKCVLKRWQDSQKRDRYFALNAQQDKFTFVSKHRSFNTWEFRCFGNVNEYHAGIRCLILSVEALRYAYKVQMNKAERLLDVGGNYQQILIEAVNTGKSITEIKAIRRARKKAETKAA